MVTEVADSVLLDTNVLVHATIAQSPLFSKAQSAISRLKQSGAEIWISRRILKEYLAVLSRPQSLLVRGKPIPASTLVAEARSFQNVYQVAEDTRQVTDELFALLLQHQIGGKQVHDANIVATMLVYGIKQIITENVGDFSRFSRLVEVLPL